MIIAALEMNQHKVHLAPSHKLIRIRDHSQNDWQLYSFWQIKKSILVKKREIKFLMWCLQRYEGHKDQKSLLYKFWGEVQIKDTNNMLRNAMMIEAKVAKKDVDVGV